MKNFQKIKSLDNEEKYERKLINKYGKDNISTIEPEDTLVVTEKIDGSNAQVRNHQGKLYVYSHKKQLDEDHTLNGFYDFVMERKEQLLKLIPEGYSFFGEWLTPHHIKYPANAYKKWYLFDIFKFDTDDEMVDTGRYLGIDHVHLHFYQLNQNAGITTGFKSSIHWAGGDGIVLEQPLVPDVYTVPIYYNLENTVVSSIEDLDKVRERLSNQSILKAKNNQEEGIVVTDTSKLVPLDEDTKGPIRVKCVNEAFKEIIHSKKPLGSGAKAALNWANKYVTEPRVRKQIYELQDNDIISKELSFDMMRDGTTSNIAKLVLGDAMEESEEIPEALTVASTSYDKNTKQVLKFTHKLVNKVIALTIKGMI